MDKFKLLEILFDVQRHIDEARLFNEQSKENLVEIDLKNALKEIKKLRKEITKEWDINE